MSNTEREEWMCVECFEDDQRHTPNYAFHGENDDLCGYHYGVKMGYIDG